MDWDWNDLFGWIYAPLVTVGTTDITFGRIGGLILMLLGVWWASSVLERALRRLALHGHHHATTSTVYAFTRLVRYVVWIVGTIIGLNFMGFELTSLAFLGGAIGVGIGFGLQNIFQNFISGIIILVEKTLKVGDFVEIASGLRGTVVEIGMRYTRVSTNDEVDVLVPNSEFINKPVTNWTYGDRTRRVKVPFGVAYGSDKEAVREAGLAAVRSVKGVLIDDAHPATVLLKNFGESSLDFEIRTWVGPDLVTHPGGTTSRILWALETELTKRGIELPFPQRDLHLRSVPEGFAQARPLQPQNALTSTEAHRADANPATR
ncbi:MAG TPA: mechanosensitive ion channel domain-containing protein [Burkholderiales bacterium]|nr:mechanosensitive ion channel domain-containing protein [Burkholderiales bacterium]